MESNAADGLVREIAQLIVRDERYAGRAWDSLWVMAIVSDAVTDVTGFTFDATGKATPGTPRNHAIDDKLEELRRVMQAPGQEPWKSVLIRIQREGDDAEVAIDFEYEDETRWQVTPGDLPTKPAEPRPDTQGEPRRSMLSASPTGISRRDGLIGAVGLIVAIGAKPAVAEDRASLFDLVDALRRSPPADRTAVERALGPLRLADENAYVRFFEASGVLLAGGTILARVDYRERKGPPLAPDLLALGLKGPCIARETVRARYPALTITGVPRGRSLAEMTAWSQDEPWGRVSFGFTAAEPDCLALVAFHFKPPATTPG